MVNPRRGLPLQPLGRLPDATNIVLALDSDALRLGGSA